MERVYKVEVFVTVDDPTPDDPENEFMNVATAVALAAQELSHRSEGFENPRSTISVTEVL